MEYEEFKIRISKGHIKKILNEHFRLFDRNYQIKFKSIQKKFSPKAMEKIIHDYEALLERHDFLLKDYARIISMVKLVPKKIDV